MASIGGMLPPVRRVAPHDVTFDGRAKMPLQASIFASWFNMLGILPWAKSGGFAALCAFARLRNSTAEQKCPCKQAFSLRGLICLEFCLGQNRAALPLLRFRAAAQLTAEQECRCGQLLLPAGGAFAFSARSFANRSMCVIGGGARVLQESVIQNL